MNHKFTAYDKFSEPFTKVTKRIDYVCVMEHYDPNSIHYMPCHVWRTTNMEFAFNRAESLLQTNSEALSVTINDGEYSYEVRRA